MMWLVFIIALLPVKINTLPTDTVTVPENTKILTNQFCTENENVTIYYANRKGVEEVSVDAFHSCEKLREVFLQENSIKLLDSATFNSNHDIEAIYLDHNELISVEDGLFDQLGSLKRLTLANNLLKEIHVTSFKSLDSLEELYLHNNDLTDLDEKELLVNLPNLREISLRNNHFNCVRLETMLRSFKERNVTLNLLPRNFGEKLRPISTRHGVECVEHGSSEESDGSDESPSDDPEHPQQLEEEEDDDEVEKILVEIRRLKDDVGELKNTIAQKSQLIEKVYYLLMMSASAILVLIVVQFTRR